jgi:hypothetical protein
MYVGQASQPFYNDLVNSTDSRTWSDTNKDNIAEPNELGPSTNALFGIRSNTNPDPSLKRPYQRLYTAAFEHELFPRIGVTAAYTRRAFENVTYQQFANSTLTGSYIAASVVDPLNSSQTLPVLYLPSTLVGQTSALIDTTSDSNTTVYNGFDFGIRGRLPNGAIFQGGTSSGRTVANTCQVANPNALRFCDQSQFDIPFRTRFRLSGSYPLVKGFRFSAVYQNLDGAERVITDTVTRAALPALTVASVAVRENLPGSSYYPRVQQLDFNVAGTIKVGQLQVKPAVDLFNALNGSAILSQVNTIGPTLNQPLSILFGRFLRFGLQVTF